MRALTNEQLSLPDCPDVYLEDYLNFQTPLERIGFEYFGKRNSSRYFHRLGSNSVELCGYFGGLRQQYALPFSAGVLSHFCITLAWAHDSTLGAQAELRFTLGSMRKRKQSRVKYRALQIGGQNSTVLDAHSELVAICGYIQALIRTLEKFKFHTTADLVVFCERWTEFFSKRFVFHWCSVEEELETVLSGLSHANAEEESVSRHRVERPGRFLERRWRRG